MKKTIILLVALSISGFCFSQKLLNNIKKAHDGEALAVTINNNGSKVITAGSDKRSLIWDSKSGKKLKTFGSHADKITAVAYNSGDKLFVTASADKRLIVWGAEDWKPKGILKGHTASISCVAFNMVNDYKVSGDEDGKVLLWDDKNKLQTSLDAHSKKVSAVGFSPDGMFFASASLDKTIKIWDAESWQVLKTINIDAKGVTSIHYSADGRYIAAGNTNGTAVICDAKSGNILRSFDDLQSTINAVYFSPDVQYLAAGGDDNRIVIWDLETQQIVKDIPAHTKGVTAIAFSDKESRLVSTGREGGLMIWDISALGFGKKKIIAESSKPELLCSTIILKENNSNGIIEADDKAKIEFSIKNNGEGLGYDLIAEIKLENYIQGLLFDNEFYIGNLDKGKSQNISIPITTADGMETSSGTFIVTVKEANGNDANPVSLDFQTKGMVNAYIMVMDYEYTSPTGKAETGAPITLKLTLMNTTNASAENIKVSFNLPENIVAVDKLIENIDIMTPNEKKIVTAQFYANKDFVGENFNIDIAIDGAAYTNVNDMDFSVAMNKELPVSPEVLAAEQPLYRGGVDPMKGLNVAKAQKQMEIGDYYALIIGIDQYKGDWTGLQNAVQDAKTVEQVIKERYKFDHFKVLYDQKATRENIIVEMEWLVANVKEKDNVFIYYSGHGDFKQNLNKGYWVPVDATTASTSKYISNSDIQTFLGGINSKHTLLVSDACFSGDIFRGKTVSVPFESSDKYFTKVHDLVSRQAISSGGIEPVMDGGRDGHSVFAYYLLKVLKNNNNKYFDASQLYEKLKIPVVNNSEQSPNFSPIKNTGDEGGQFIFIKK